jgi:hypothetical protein
MDKLLVTYIVVDRLINNPYKKSYTKDYIYKLNRINDSDSEEIVYEEFLSLLNEAPVLLKKYKKLGRNKRCAEYILRQYIYWYYETCKPELAETLIKNYEETTGLKYTQDYVILQTTTTTKSNINYLIKENNQQPNNSNCFNTFIKMFWIILTLFEVYYIYFQ